MVEIFLTFIGISPAPELPNHFVAGSLRRPKDFTK